MKRFVWLLLLCVVASATPAADTAAPARAGFNDELRKQEAIYRSQGEAVPEGYTLDRSLAVYADALAGGFERVLASLGPDDRWLDIGAGEGRAVLDYYSPGYDRKVADAGAHRSDRARAVAMSIEDRRTPEWRARAASLDSGRLQYLTERRLREYSPADIGQFELITDVIGGFSYTTDLSLFMEKALALLRVGGYFFTVLQDVHTEAGATPPFYKGAPYLTEMENADGSELRVCSWLKSISCVEVSCEAKKGWKPPVEGFAIRKLCGDIRVPPLAATHYQSGTPPERRFRLKR